MSYKHMIQAAPLQVYASALVFSPSQSLTKRLFSHEQPKWMSSTARLEDEWDNSLQTLEGHGSFVRAVAISMDGQYVASGASEIKIWDTFTGACIHTLEGTSRSLAFSASEDKLLLASCAEYGVKIWDTRSGTCLHTLRDLQDQVLSVAFSFSQRKPLLASGSAGGTINIWNPSDGTCNYSLRCIDGVVYSLAFSPSTSRPLLVSSSFFGFVKLWDPVQGTHIQTLKSTSPVRSVAFVSSGHEPLLASGLYDGTVRIWDPATYTCLRAIAAHSEEVTSLSASDSGLLASGSVDGTIKIWDPSTGTQVGTFAVPSSYRFPPVALSHNGGMVIGGGSSDALVRIWDTTQTSSTRQSPLVPKELASLGNSQVALASQGSATVEIWDAAKGTQLQALRGHEDLINTIAISHTTNQLASASNDKTVKVWNTPTSIPVCVHTLRGHTESVETVVFSHDGLQLASASSDATVMVWNTTTGTCTKVIQIDQDSSPCVTFSNDGQYLAISSWGCDIHNIKEGCGHREPKKIQTGGYHDVVEFSRDDKYIAVSGRGHITVWAVNSSRRLVTLKSETLCLNQLQFQHNDSLLSTELGIISLPLLSDIEKSRTETISDMILAGYGFSEDKAWITKDGMRILWLPLGYQPASECDRTCAVQGSTITIAPISGGVYRMQLRWNR